MVRMIAMQTPGGGSDAVDAAPEVGVSVAAAEGAATAQDPVQDDPAQDPNKMQIDSWESVSQQPSW